jgi:hypothetical protein
MACSSSSAAASPPCMPPPRSTWMRARHISASRRPWRSCSSTRDAARLSAANAWLPPNARAQDSLYSAVQAQLAPGQAGAAPPAASSHPPHLLGRRQRICQRLLIEPLQLLERPGAQAAPLAALLQLLPDVLAQAGVAVGQQLVVLDLRAGHGRGRAGWVGWGWGAEEGARPWRI